MHADIQHEVSHDAKNSHFYHVFSTYEDGRRQTRARRGVVCPYLCLQDHKMLVEFSIKPSANGGVDTNTKIGE